MHSYKHSFCAENRISLSHCFCPVRLRVKCVPGSKFTYGHEGEQATEEEKQEGDVQIRV